MLLLYNDGSLNVQNVDIHVHFQNKNQAQVLGNKGIFAISKMDAIVILRGISKEFGIH